MKWVFTFLVFSFSLGKSLSQSCISLGCAAAHTGIVTDGTLPDILDLDYGELPGSCYIGNPYKQIFWEFFYSPAGGDFVQAFTESNSGITLDIDYAVFDAGTTAPDIHCPLSIASWTELDCNIMGSGYQPTGPGQPGGEGSTLTTIPGHYYAIAIIIWQGVSNGGEASYSFDASTPTLNGVPLTDANCADANIVLPVKLSSFNVSSNQCTVNLNWEAESETNFQDYEIQSGSDGQNFTTIAKVSAAQSAEPKKYSYQQNNPQQGKLFYRLKMVDLNGKVEYSDIIIMNVVCNKAQMRVYPNPVGDLLNINIANTEGRVIARLFDISGRLIYTGNMNNGANTIPMSGVVKGMYMLKIITDKETRNIKIIK